MGLDNATPAKMDYPAFRDSQKYGTDVMHEKRFSNSIDIVSRVKPEVDRALRVHLTK